MADNLAVPSNIENPVVLRRFLNQLAINGSPNSGSWNSESIAEFMAQAKVYNPSLDFLALVAKLNELRNNIRGLVEADLETVLLQNKDDVALIAEQFGTFYDQAMAASWYGLSVKAGGVVAGLEIGSLDPDVTTPGDESSYFRVIADNFIVGRAYEDLSVEEKSYLADNGLPAFGTVYNEDKVPVPALIITWDGVENVYKHYFNGVVQFGNVEGVPSYALTDYVDTQIDALQSQVDGTISSWFYNGVPTLSNAPANTWDATDKVKHVGDMYYDKLTGYSYRFAYEDLPNDTPNAGVIYSWIRISDTDITKALADAARAQETADGKITTFFQPNQPVAEGVGDFWIDSDNGNKYLRWSGTEWEYIRDLSKDEDISNALLYASVAYETANGKIDSFFQPTAPVGTSVGDIWFDTDDGNKVYRWSGSAWVGAQDSKIAQALLDAADAQSTADGKITSFYTTVAPSVKGVGDLWVNSSTNLVLRWSGSSWTTIDFAAAVNNGTTTIIGGKISTNSLSAISANLGEVNAGIIYNYNGNASNYTMKIDLNSGRIIIK